MDEFKWIPLVNFKDSVTYLGDYTCPYTYVLVAITLFPVNRLYAVKTAVSVLFDFLLAYFVFDIVYN